MSRTKKSQKNDLRTGNGTHLPLPLGPHMGVAYADLLVGKTRKASVLVRLFYPQQANESEQTSKVWPEWLPHPAYQQGLFEVSGLKSKRVLNLLQRWTKAEILVPAIPNGKLGQKECKYPTIVFSHGVGGFRNSNAALCIELASHGFVIAALEHRDNSACLSFYARNSERTKNKDAAKVAPCDIVESDDELDFGQELANINYKPPSALAPMSSEFEWVRHRYAFVLARNRRVAAFRNRQIHQRVLDCSRAVDLLEALNAGSQLNNLLHSNMNFEEFRGVIDMDKLVIMGQSFGGGTAILSATKEPRFKVVVAFDPWMYPIENELLDSITQPVINVNTETLEKFKKIKAKLAEIMPVCEGEDPDRRMAWTLNGSSHLQQCDVPFVFPSVSSLLSGRQLRGKMHLLTVHDLTARLALQFIGKWLDIEIDKDYLQYIDEKKHRMRPTFKKSEIQR